MSTSRHRGFIISAAKLMGVTLSCNRLQVKRIIYRDMRPISTGRPHRIKQQRHLKLTSITVKAEQGKALAAYHLLSMHRFRRPEIESVKNFTSTIYMQPVAC